MLRRIWKIVETKAGKTRIAKTKKKEKKEKERKKQKEREQKKEEKKKKLKKDRLMEVKKVAEEWEIWNKEKKVAKSKEEAEKLVS